jgi:hypothetical protein
VLDAAPSALAAVAAAAAHVEPYLRVDGTKVWSLMQLERHLHPDAYGRVRGAISPVVGHEPPAPEPQARTRWQNAARSAGPPAGHSDQMTARVTAKSIEYPIEQLELAGAGWPWRPTALLALTATAAIGIGLVPAAASRRNRR